MSITDELLLTLLESNQLNHKLLERQMAQDERLLKVLSAVDNMLGLVSGHLQLSTVNPSIMQTPLGMSVLEELITTLSDGGKLSQEQLTLTITLLKHMQSGLHGKQEKLVDPGPTVPESFVKLVNDFVERNYGAFSEETKSTARMAVFDWQAEQEQRHKGGGYINIEYVK